MIPCVVTILVLYLHLFFYISRGLDTNRSIVGASRYFPRIRLKCADIEVVQVTPLQRPIIYLMTTHTLFIASSSLLLRPICAVPSLSLAEFVSPRSMVGNQPSEVGPKRWVDKGGVQPKIPTPYFTLA